MRNVRVKPGELRLPPDRAQGADPLKLQRQMAEFGASFEAMPPLQATRGSGGELMLNDGVTRATRAYSVAPDFLIAVEIIDIRPDWDLRSLPQVKEVAV